MENGIKDFTDLDAWKMARKLRSEIYSVCKTLPKDESYALASQMKRAAISVTANIAEGYALFVSGEYSVLPTESRVGLRIERSLRHCTRRGIYFLKSLRRSQQSLFDGHKASERLHSRDKEQEGKAQGRRMMSGHYFPFSLFHFL
jgi:23S rRNA-intervening sequence protein